MKVSGGAFTGGGGVQHIHSSAAVRLFFFKITFRLQYYTSLVLTHAVLMIFHELQNSIQMTPPLTNNPDTLDWK